MFSDERRRTGYFKSLRRAQVAEFKQGIVIRTVAIHHDSDGRSFRTPDGCKPFDCDFRQSSSVNRHADDHRIIHSEKKLSTDRFFQINFKSGIFPGSLADRLNCGASRTGR